MAERRVDLEEQGLPLGLELVAGRVVLAELLGRPASMLSDASGISEK
jgi:hypothetical protein